MMFLSDLRLKVFKFNIGKKFPGEVEIHVNGIRYASTVRGDQKVDVLFDNIKHLFFQPCNHELVVLIHIHLKDAIIIGKKKTVDVQFFREVIGIPLLT